MGLREKDAGGISRRRRGPKRRSHFWALSLLILFPFFCGVMSDPKKREKKGNKMQCDIFAAKYKQVYG